MRSNEPRIGATVVVTAADARRRVPSLSQSSYYSHDDLRLHFGLGAATVADRIEVRWPGGASRDAWRRTSVTIASA